MENFKSKKRGFTLIELLVVVTIIVLLSGMTLAYYNNLSSAKELETQAQQAGDVLELAKKKAAAGDIANPSCVTFGGYRVIVLSSTAYRLDFCCQGASTCSTTTPIATYTLPASITVDPPNPAPVQFLPLSGGTTGTPFNLVLKSSKSSECIKVSVDDDGLVSKDQRYTGSGC